MTVFHLVALDPEHEAVVGVSVVDGVREMFSASVIARSWASWWDFTCNWAPLHTSVIFADALGWCFEFSGTKEAFDMVDKQYAHFKKSCGFLQNYTVEPKLKLRQELQEAGAWGASGPGLGFEKM